MGIPTFQPKVQVVVKKNVNRNTVTTGTPTSKRFQSASREMDVTNWLGDGGSVVTDKSVRAPAGMFSFVLADRADPKQLETLYGLIEPMDVVEIRMARNPVLYAGGKLPIVMRGFVTEITREEAMTPNGPQRRVVVRGQDYGKLLQIMQIAYLPNEVTGQRLLTYFKFFQNYTHDSTSIKTASQFVQDMNTNVILKFISDMQNAGGGGASPVLNLKVDATVSKGLVFPFGSLQQFEGSVYDMLAHYGDVGPWNELFVDDRQDGVYLVYRPTPFKDTSGGMIQDGATAPDTISVTDKEVISLAGGRSDSGVYNYYWVNPAVMNLNNPSYLQLAAAEDPSNVYIKDYPNSQTSLYGFRRLEVSTQQGPRVDGKAENDHIQASGDVVGWAKDRRKVLTDNNKDNVVFETGGMQIQGNESLRAGMSVSLTRARQSKPSEYYAVSVRQSFIPYRSYTTSVSFERGTGFINRIQDNGASAYLAEMNAKGLYGG